MRVSFCARGRDDGRMGAESGNCTDARDGVFVNKVDELGCAEAEYKVTFVRGVNTYYLGAEDFAVLDFSN